MAVWFPVVVTWVVHVVVPPTVVLVGAVLAAV